MGWKKKGQKPKDLQDLGGGWGKEDRYRKRKVLTTLLSQKWGASKDNIKPLSVWSKRTRGGTH